jgi:hypothetical protein
MNKFLRIAIFYSFGVFLWSGCASEAPPSNATKLRIGVQNALVLQYADDARTTLDTLKVGDTVLYCNKISNFKTKRVVCGITMNEPWLKVKTKNGKTGWVYGALVQFDALTDSNLATQLLKPRFEHFFGKRLSERVSVYNQRYDRANTQEMIATVFREGRGLGDSLQGVLHRRIATDSVLLTDMFWIRGMVRGLTPRLSDNHLRYNMAYDFNAWHRHAFGTRGEADEQFLKVLMTAYNDGVACRIPAWQQCDDLNCYTPLSRLGSGTHLRVLKACDIALSTSKCFESELLELKTALINDIIDGKYAQEATAVQAEMMEILATPLLHILQQSDRVALDNRLKAIRQASYKGLAMR